MTTHRNSAPAHTRSLPVRQLVLTLLGWSIALIIFFPILWMVLTGFKTETAAIADPSFLFSPTLESYQEVQARSGYARFALNSIAVAFGSTFLALLIAIPSAYAMAFLPTKRTKGTLLWMLSTKMLNKILGNSMCIVCNITCVFISFYNTRNIL